MPRVSVIVPTYQCARFISRALHSAFAQTYRDFEVIVADDGSSDGTADVVAAEGWPVRYFRQANGGLASARNLAISHASGEFIAFLDADDMWYPHRLEQQVAYLDRHPECVLVHGDVTIVDEADLVIHPAYSQVTGRRPLRGRCARDLLAASTIHVPSVMERRAACERVGGFDERLRSMEDYLHWLRIALLGGEFGYIDEPLALYRWRAGSLTRDRVSMAEAEVEVCRILLDECALDDRIGPGAREAVEQRRRDARRYLTYGLRLRGENARARCHALRLIAEHPRGPWGYVELAKSCLPVRLAGAIRTLKAPA